MRPPEHCIKSSVRSLAAYVPGEQPKQNGIVKLNTNENPYPPAPGVAALLQDFSVDVLRRYPNPSCEALRQQLGQLYGVSADCVAVGNGSDEILALCTRAFVEDAQRVGFFDPSYSLYPVLAAIQEAACQPTPLGPAFEWRPPDVKGCGLFLLANPNAPTGVSYDLGDIREFCECFEGVVVIDEAYAEFARENCLALARELPNVLVVRTLSKSYSLAGARVGYAVGHPILIEALMKIKDSYNVSAFSQAVALAALRDQAYLSDTISRIRATRERLLKVLVDSGFAVIPSETNFVFVRPPRMPARDVFEALRERNIFVRYFSDAPVREYLRITVGTDEEIDTLIGALKEMDLV